MADTDISLSVDLDVKDAEKTAKDLQKEVEDIFNTRKGEQSASLTNLEIQMKKNYDAARSLSTAMQELADTPVETDAYKKILEDQQHYLDMKDKLIEQMSAMEEKANATETQGAKLYDTEKYQNLVKQMEQTEEALGRLGIAREKMEQSGTAYVLGRETAEYQKQQTQLDSINDKLKQQLIYHSEIEAKASQGGVAQASRDANMEVIAANSSLMAMNMAIRSIGRIIPGVSTSAISGVVMLTRSVLRLTKLTKEQVIMAIGKVKAAFASLFAFIMAHPIVLVITALIAAIIALIKKVKELWNKSEEAVDNFIELAREGLEKLGDLAGNLIKTLVNGFIKLGNLIPYTVIRAIGKLIDKIKALKNYISESLDEMAAWNSGNNDLNKSLSNITSSLAYLKSSIAAAVAPIITYVEPMLTRLLDMLAKVFEIIGMIIAKITGATTFQRAIRKQKEYANSLKETNGQLASFDKLNVLNDSKGQTVDFEIVGLEDVDLPDWMEDFEILAKKLSKKINKFLKSIDWDYVKERAKNLAIDIADFINGLDIGDELGIALGEVVNTITTFVNNFLDTFKGKEFGEKLRDFFINGIKTIHWDEVGSMFSGTLNKLADIIVGLMSPDSEGKLLGEKIGNAFAEMVTSALTGIEWEKMREAMTGIATNLAAFLNTILIPENMETVGTTLGETLNTIFTGINVFANQAEWEQWGQSIADGIMKFFETVDWKATAITIGNLVGGFLDMLVAAVTKLSDPDNLEKLMKDIKDFFENIPWTDIREKAVAISKQLREVLSAIWQALKDSGAYDEIIKFIADFLSEKENWEKLFEGFKDDVVGDVFWEQIKGIFEQVGKHIANAINTLIDFIADCFNNIGNFLGALNPFSDTTWEDYLSGKKTSTSYSSGGITRVRAPEIRGYATGAVLPPNKPFLGILGDQKNGTNVEAPLSTIKQAVTEVLSEMGINLKLEIESDSNRLFKAVRKEAKVYYNQTKEKAFG